MNPHIFRKENVKTDDFHDQKKNQNAQSAEPSHSDGFEMKKSPDRSASEKKE